MSIDKFSVAAYAGNCYCAKVLSGMDPTVSMI